MDVNAIYDFLSKKTPVTHNTDQLIGNQKIHHIAKRLADYLNELGYRARAVPTNNNYRRSLDVYSTHPDFSHRFGAIVSGIAGQGMSGNVMTKEYGAAVYLSTVVTDAVLKSDPCFRRDISSINTAKSVLSATRRARQKCSRWKRKSMCS